MMGLFNQIVGALDNPNQQASPNQLGSIVNVVQQLSSSHGTNPATTQIVLSTLGNYVRSALQEKRATGGNDQAQALVNQFSGTSPNLQAVQALFSPTQQAQAVQETSQKTGLNANTVQAMLPLVVPLILNLLRSGASNQNTPGNQSNSVLNAFLDTDGNGQVDIGDAINLVGRFLNKPR